MLTISSIRIEVGNVESFLSDFLIPMSRTVNERIDLKLKFNLKTSILGRMKVCSYSRALWIY
jgi:hypothetical protein